MRCNNSGYSEGDYIPITTSLGNVINCKILQLEWTVNFSKKDTAMLLDEKALLIYADELEFRRQNKFDNIGLNTGAERSGKTMSTFVKKRLIESDLYTNKEKLQDILNTDNWTIKTFTDCSKINLNEYVLKFLNFKNNYQK